FQWTPYEDPAIQAVIPDEFLQNPNAWHAKVALISYATVKMHQSDRVLRQFRCRQPIPWHLRCLMISIKSTYGNCIRIGRDSGPTTSKCRKIDPWQAVFTVSRRETAVITCPKGKTLAFKSKTKGR
ncbi:hypothetical protein Goshw_013284, partial [Gossypium schwendimanii]|nr:hypothetical protein [Gossypium schwendimanii]